MEELDNAYSPCNESGTMLPPDPDTIPDYAPPAEVVTFQTPGVSDYASTSPEAVVEELAQAETVLDGTQYQTWDEERKHIKRVFYESNKGTLKLQSIPMCGHRFRPGSEPKQRNCQPCWFTFFSAHKELVEACHEVFKQFGQEGLAQIRGPKFASNYVKFMGTLANWQQAYEAAQTESQVEAGEPKPAE